MQHGTYNAQGIFIPQRVRLGTTRSGKHGLFTDGLMAWPLSKDVYEILAADHQMLFQYAQSKGFTL